MTVRFGPVYPEGDTGAAGTQSGAGPAYAGLLRRLGRAVCMLSLMTAMCLTGGCAQVDSVLIRTGIEKSPYYHLGDTEWDHGGVEEYWFNQIPSELNETYRELYSRLSNYEDEAELYAGIPTETFWKVYYAVLADHPEFFWLDSNIEAAESALTGKITSYKVIANLPAELRDKRRLALEAAADECISRIPEDASDYDRIRMVYEYIIDTVDYVSDSPNNQNIQSALLYRESVCAGYAKAFQYILHRMGMFCTYVTGKTENGDEHAWNVVRLDGLYYNVDTTWGDPVFAGAQEDSEGNADQYTAVMNYNYLCCTDEELCRTHIPEADFTLPSCTDGRYNYYKLNHLYYEGFDYDTIYSALMQSVWEERKYIVLKFDSRETLDEASRAFFEEGMLQEPAQYLMEVYGVSSWNYRYNVDEDFLEITIYWML